MMRLILAFVLLLLLPSLAFAQPAKIVGPVLKGITSLNGWTPTLGASDISAQAPATGGTGNAVGDVLTLADGCATHATVAVSGVQSGAVTGYFILNRGVCSAAPSNPVAVASSTGSGSGATFNTVYAPIVAGIFPNINLVATSTLFLGTLPASGYTGTEALLVGPLAGAQFTGASNFLVSLGTSSCGGASGTPFTASSMTCVGVDAGRILNGTGTLNVDAFGTGALAHQNAGITNISALGNHAFGNLNTANEPANLVGVGPNACMGTLGSATFNNGICIGAGNAPNLTGLSTFLLMGPVGMTTLANGNDIMLVSTGGNGTVDAPFGVTRHYMNINNAIIAEFGAPTVSSGFGTSPTIPHGSSTAGFQVNAGTGGTASSGVISMGSAAQAPNGWACIAVDGTNPASSNTIATPTSVSTITLTNYSRTTGAVTAWAASDVITVSCNGF